MSSQWQESTLSRSERNRIKQRVEDLTFDYKHKLERAYRRGDFRLYQSARAMVPELEEKRELLINDSRRRRIISKALTTLEDPCDYD
jgi:hypothetical protein